MVPDAREHVEEMPVLAADEPRGVGGEQREAVALCLRPEPVVPGLLAAVEMALELGVDVEAAVDADQPVEKGARPVDVAAGEAPGHRPLLAAGETDEAAGVLGEVAEGRRPLALGRAHLDPGDEPAEVLVPLAILGEERELAAVVERHLGAHQRGEAEAGARAVEPRRAEHAVAIDQRDGALIEPRGLLGEGLGERGRLEKAEGTASVELHVHGSAQS